MDPAAQNANHDDVGVTDTAAESTAGGFGIEPATNGSSLPTPSYTNFSPLFSAANLSGLPPVAPIAFRAGTPSNCSVDPSSSYFPSFLDGGAGSTSATHNGNGFLMDQHGGLSANAAFSYAALATPVPVPCKALAGMKRRRLDDFSSGMMSFPSGDQPLEATVGYARPAPLDAYPSGGYPVAYDMTSPHLASESMSYFAQPASYSAQQKPPPMKQTEQPPPQQRQQQQPQERSSSQPEAQLTPESAVDAVLRKTSGSSCHQCKNRRESRHLNFCRNRTRGTSDDKKKKICRKKFCDHCIIKFNYQPRLPSKNSCDWECPSCLGICVCAACRRKNDPQLQAAQLAAYATPANVTAPVSPTLSFAHKLFYNPDLMVQGPETQGHLGETMPFFNSAF